MACSSRCRMEANASTGRYGASHVPGRPLSGADRVVLLSGRVLANRRHFLLTLEAPVSPTHAGTEIPDIRPTAGILVNLAVIGYAPRWGNRESVQKAGVHSLRIVYHSWVMEVGLVLEEFAPTESTTWPRCSQGTHTSTGRSMRIQAQFPAGGAIWICCMELR